jgi:hypothetical protein
VAAQPTPLKRRRATPTPPAPTRASRARDRATVDAAPFLAWAEQRIRDHDTRQAREQRRRGLEPLKSTGGVEALLNDIGWSSENARRRLQHWRANTPYNGAHHDQYGRLLAPADLIEAALEHAGSAMWELYEDTDTAELEEHFCPTCSEEVAVLEERCAWCSTKIPDRPRTAARGRQSKPRPRPPRRQPTPLRALKPAPAPKPAEPAEPTGAPAGNLHSSPPEYQGPLPTRVMWEAAWRYYSCHYGFLRIARLLRARWPSLGYRSDRSLASTLQQQFQRNGWSAREQRQATIAANYRHGMSIHRHQAAYTREVARQRRGGLRPRCRATTKRTGKRCRNHALPGERHCYAHSKKRSQQREAALTLTLAGAQRELVDSRPFVAWLAARACQYGGITRTAEIVGLNRTIVGQILARGGTSHPGQLTRRLIEHALNCALRNDPTLTVPRFRDLYDPDSQAAAPALAIAA